MSMAKAVSLPMERSVSEKAGDDLEETVPYQAAVGSLFLPVNWNETRYHFRSEYCCSVHAEAEG